MNRRDEILSKLNEIELLSTSTLHAMQVINNPDADGASVARALELDPSMTSNVLRFANSAYFGCSHEIHSVKEAVVRLGMGTISRMLYTVEVSQWTRRPVLGYDLSPQALWSHVISTAVATEILAKKLKINAPNYAFTAALLHDIGKIILGTYLEVDAEPIRTLAIQEKIPFDEAEVRILGINHAEAGAELLRLWKLPHGIVDVVRWHHSPNMCDGEKRPVDLIHVADVISMMAGNGLGVDGLNYAVCPDSEKRLGIQIKIVEQVLCELQDEVSKLDQVYE